MSAWRETDGAPTGQSVEERDTCRHAISLFAHLTAHAFVAIQGVQPYSVAILWCVVLGGGAREGGGGGGGVAWCLVAEGTPRGEAGVVSTIMSRAIHPQAPLYNENHTRHPIMPRNE